MPVHVHAWRGRKLSDRSISGRRFKGSRYYLVSAWFTLPRLAAVKPTCECTPGAVCSCRVLVGAALALSAAGSAVVHLLPEGPPHEAQEILNLLQMSSFLKDTCLVPDLAGALLAQRAELAEQLVAGLAAAILKFSQPQATEVWQREAGSPWGLLPALGQVSLRLQGLPLFVVLDHPFA